MLKVIADSGSTKTDWTVIDADGEVVASCHSQGLNPYHLSEEEILGVLSEVKECLCAEMGDANECVGAIYFYGSGVTDAMKPQVSAMLLQVFPGADCHAESDMLGAARALFGRQKGVAFILGTGSNNCYYDGGDIVEGIPPLGYILGDEGSGTAIGKAFLRFVLRNPMAESLKLRYFEWAGVDDASIINKVYRQPLANRYLASIARFVGETLRSYPEDEACRHFRLQLQGMYDAFLSDTLTQYVGILGKHQVKVGEEDRIPVGFVGSVAAHFGEFLTNMPKPFCLERIMASPMEGLVSFHSCS